MEHWKNMENSRLAKTLTETLHQKKLRISMFITVNRGRKKQKCLCGFNLKNIKIKN